jgi:Cu-Zn family superoxide dismutase
VGPALAVVHHLVTHHAIMHPSIARSASLAAAVLVTVAGAACHRRSGTERSATATLSDSAGRPVGTITLRDAVGEPLSLEGQLRGLSAGTHGIHFHAVGRCDPAGAFASAGGHFNPASRKHGLESGDGPHAGDLPNVVVGPDGTGTLRTTTTRVTLGAETASLLDADGSAVVVHAGSDDQRTDPAGNSGARVACGVIVRR